MRRPISILAAVLFPLLILVPAEPQTSSGTGGQNPDPLTAQYNQAMLAKDWAGAIATAQQLVAQKATSLNLKYWGMRSFTPARRTPHWRLMTWPWPPAEKEKPADDKAMASWKDGLSQIYIGKGNALLKLKRNSEAIESYNLSAELATNKGRLTSMSAPCSITLAIRITPRRPAASVCRRTPRWPMPGLSWGRISLPMHL